MNTMNVPGFTADASLYRVSNHYYVHGMYHRTESNVYPADYLDQNCLDACKVDCGIACAGLLGSNKAWCIRECAADNRECNRICTHPDSPPTGGGGGGTTGGGGTGLIIYGNYCGPGHGDDTGMTPPIDAVDAACRAHDLCYRDRGYFSCSCDYALITSMGAAIMATPTVEGQAAGIAVMAHFLGQPCWCLVPPGPGHGGYFAGIFGGIPCLY